jgi:organic hydroperoxide reductase OsmC/OhrA
MSEHKATVRWSHAQGEFLKGTFSRAHSWSFDGGVTVPASAAPSAVKPPLSNPANVDPEEAYVASIASCHMLTFLWAAYRKGIEVSSYEDEAVGILTKNEQGRLWISAVTLRPRIVFAGTPPPADVVEQLHHAAHEGCYIANSVKTSITVEGGA